MKRSKMIWLASSRELDQILTPISRVAIPWQLFCNNLSLKNQINIKFHKNETSSNTSIFQITLKGTLKTHRTKFLNIFKFNAFN